MMDFSQQTVSGGVGKPHHSRNLIIKDLMNDWRNNVIKRLTYIFETRAAVKFTQLMLNLGRNIFKMLYLSQ